MARFKPVLKKDKIELDALPIVEGQLIVLDDAEELYVDSGPLKRKKIGGKFPVVTENSPTIEFSGDGSAGNPLKAELIQGAGTELNPYLIHNLEELNAFRDTINSVIGYSAGKHWKLMADIDLQGSSSNPWIPIGEGSDFRGSFDGGGHTIKNLFIVGAGVNQNAGFFKQLSLDVHVRDLHFDVVTLSGGGTLGSLAGATSNGGSDHPFLIERCSATNVNVLTPTQLSHIGGMIGGIGPYGIMEDCFAEINALSGDGTSYIGGLIGINYSAAGAAVRISRCYAIGYIGNNYPYKGGIIGRVQATFGYTFESCYYDTTTFVGINPVGAGTTPAGIEGKTTAQMKTQSTYVGWDFNDVWEMDSAGSGYPVLRAVGPGSGLGCSCLPSGFQKFEKVDIIDGIAGIDLNKEDISIFIVSITATTTIAFLLPANELKDYIRTFEIHINLATAADSVSVTLPSIVWIDDEAPSLAVGKTSVIIIRTDGNYYIGNLAYTY